MWPRSSQMMMLGSELVADDQTTAPPGLSLVPDQPPIIRNALILSDFALELRLQGRRVEMAEQVLSETPHGRTRSATMATLMRQRHDDMLAEFDKLATTYMEAKLDELASRGAKP